MLEHHSCAHVFACHFCGLVFSSLDALKAHDGCEEFATALVQRISSSGEVEVSSWVVVVFELEPIMLIIFSFT